MLLVMLFRIVSMLHHRYRRYLQSTRLRQLDALDYRGGRRRADYHHGGDVPDRPTKFRSMQALIDKLSLVMREQLTGLMVIRAFNAQKHEEARFDKANQT